MPNTYIPEMYSKNTCHQDYKSIPIVTYGMACPIKLVIYDQMYDNTLMVCTYIKIYNQSLSTNARRVVFKKIYAVGVHRYSTNPILHSLLLLCVGTRIYIRLTYAVGFVTSKTGLQTAFNTFINNSNLAHFYFISIA